MTSPEGLDNEEAVAEEIVQTPATPGAEALPTSEAEDEENETPR